MPPQPSQHLTATVSDAFLAAQNPTLEIQEMLHGDKWAEALMALRAVGSGSSAWAQLYSLRLQASKPPPGKL